MNKVLLYFIVVSVVLIGCNRVYHDEDNLIDRQLTPLRSDQIVEFKVISIKPRLIGGEIELKRLADKYNTHNFAGKVEVEYIADRYGRTRDLIIVNEDSLDVETINAVKLIIQNLKYQAGRDKNLVSQNVKMKQNLYFENYDTDENTNSADQVKEVTKPNKETVIKKLERPEPIGEKEIDEFVKKAFDIYDSTNSASNRIRNIDQKIQELLQIQNIVGNPIAMIKKEAKLIENSVKSLKTQSEELIGLSQNVLKSATKVKFTKIASATRNIKSSIEAVTASAELLLKLVADIPEILKKIAEFEKANNIVSNEDESETVIEQQRDTNSFSNTVNAKSSIITVNEAEVESLKPEFGQIIYTKDTKKLLFFDGEKFKKIILDDWK